MLKIGPIHVDFSEADRKHVLSAIEDRLAAGFVSQGAAVRDFEASFARYVGARHAVALSSGSAALEIAIRIKATSERVLVPANTNFATAASVLRAGAKLGLVDVDPTTLSPSVADLERAVTPDTVGIVIVHMGGIITPQMKAIQAWCRARNLWLLEDCAHAHGSRLDDVHAGRFGFAGAFSFFATKVITSGEGGMLITDDDSVAENARLHRNLGKPGAWENYHVLLGTNARMTELSAIVGSVQLARLDEFIAARTEVARVYTERLREQEQAQAVLPVGPCSWYKYVVMLPQGADRAALKTAMKERGVAMGGEIYERPLHHQPALEQHFRGRSFPASEAACARHVCPPIHSALRAEQAQYVIDALLEELRKQGAT